MRRRNDYLVRFRSEEDIAEVAAAWRDAARLSDKLTFDIVAFVDNVLTPQLNRKAMFRVRIFDRKSDNEAPGFVKFSPFSMHLDRQIWTMAQFDHANSRFVIAHEVGHAVLHHDRAKAFSNDPSNQINGQKERSAEWQVNTFAGHFLLSDCVVGKFRDPRHLAFSCNVNIELARERLSSFIKASEQPPLHYEGDFCEECGNFTLVRDGACLKCVKCGTRQDVGEQ